MTSPRVAPLRPRHKKYEDLEQVRQDLHELFRLVQPKAARIFKTTPIAADLTEGEVVILDDESSTRRVYYKVNGALRYAALT